MLQFPDPAILKRENEAERRRLEQRQPLQGSRTNQMAEADVETGKRGTTQGRMTFEGKFIKKIREQVHSKGVGFLLGAGSSYLDGKGYPVAASLWDVVKPALPPADQGEIQNQIDSGCPGLEEALDRLDDGAQGDLQLRHGKIFEAPER
jgi:hypothetical protein